MLCFAVSRLYLDVAVLIPNSNEKTSTAKKKKEKLSQDFENQIIKKREIFFMLL